MARSLPKGREKKLLKSESANRLISLLVLWGIVTIVLLNGNGISLNHPAFLIITIVSAVLGTMYHLYKLLLNKD